MCLYLPIKRVVAGASLLCFLFVCPFFVFSMLKIVTVNGIDVYASMTHTHLKQFIVMYLLYVVCCMLYVEVVIIILSFCFDFDRNVIIKFKL